MKAEDIKEAFEIADNVIQQLYDKNGVVEHLK